MENKPVIIYLHGMIVENQGADARHPEYGNYEFNNIVKVFRENGFEVIAELRKPNTDVNEYARHVQSQVKGLLEDGHEPSEITVIGASKGSMIAMVASTLLENPDINFVFMAACNEWVAANFKLNPCGNILSIYEESDDIGKSCGEIMGLGPCIPRYEEIMLKTGKRHGFLFKPMPEWVDPAMKWAGAE